MTVTRKWEAVLPAAVGGAIGASLAQLLEELSLKSKPTLLAGMVEGPLLLFGGSSHSVIGTALLDALLLFVVWQGMRDRRWLGLATVAVVVNLASVGVAIDLDWASISRIGARYSSPSPLRVFTHHSPEGFVVLAFGAFGWHVFLEGCLIHAWTRPATFSRAVCEEPLTRPSRPLVRLVRDVLPPLLAGAAFGFAIAGCLDTAEAYFDDPRRRLPGIISVLRNISAGLFAFQHGPVPPWIGMSLYFAAATTLLWRACLSRFRRRLAALVYVVLIASQGVFLAIDLCRESGMPLMQSLSAIRAFAGSYPGRATFLLLAIIAWHAYAVWCLVRWRPEDSTVGG